MSELKPCPFCGCPASIYDYKHNEMPLGYDVHCLGCEVTTKSYKTKEEAIEQWNTRVADKKEGGE